MIYVPVITIFVLYAFFFHKFIRKYEFIHLVLLNNSRMIFYIVLFTSYAILKLIAIIDKRYTLKKMNLNKKTALSKQW